MRRINVQQVRVSLTRLSALIVFGLLSACGSNSEQVAVSNQQDTSSTSQIQVVDGQDNKTEKDAHMIITGQVLYQTMEGGFYGFVANDGRKYMPSGLAKQYRKNGLILEISAQLMPDILTTQQFGEVIKVLEVKVIDESQVSDGHQSM